MADVTLLKTPAECDVALASLIREKASYAHRDYNQNYADNRAGERASLTAAQLAKAIDDVAHYTAEAARAGLTDTERRTAQRNLINATARRDRLQLSQETTSGPVAYLADVDDDQNTGQIAVLQQAIDAVTAHRASLPA